MITSVSFLKKENDNYEKLSFLIVLLLFILAVLSVFAKDLPRVAILATGATIAGSTDAGGVAASGYKAGVLMSIHL